MGSDSLVYAEFEYLHLTDWTSRVEGGFEYIVMEPVVNFVGGYSIEFAILNVGSKDVFRRVMDAMRHNDCVMEVLKVRPLNVGYPKRLMVVLKSTLSDSTRYRASLLGGLEVVDHIVDGVERWGFVFPGEESIELFRKSIEVSGRVLSIKYRRVNMDDVLGLINTSRVKALLPNSEYKVLRRAYEMGFFEKPRRAGLRELAKELKLTPTTIDYELRSGLRRLLSILLGLG